MSTDANPNTLEQGEESNARTELLKLQKKWDKIGTKVAIKELWDDIKKLEEIAARIGILQNTKISEITSSLHHRKRLRRITDMFKGTINSNNRLEYIRRSLLLERDVYGKGFISGKSEDVSEFRELVRKAIQEYKEIESVEVAIEFSRDASSEDLLLGEAVILETLVCNRSKGSIYNVTFKDSRPESSDFEYAGEPLIVWECLKANEKRVVRSTLRAKTVVGEYPLPPATLSFADSNKHKHRILSNKIILEITSPGAYLQCPNRECKARMPRNALWCGKCGTELKNPSLRSAKQ